MMTEFEGAGFPMPVFFIGHGSPMNAVEDNEFSRAWADAAKSIPLPKAILCVSAHWETTGTQVTAMERPRTIHDFGGFPDQLYKMEYPAQGSPDLAHLVKDTIQTVPVTLSREWGLDHGTWSVLCRMFPKADIPVVQLSLDLAGAPATHYAIGRELKGLRKQGVLIVGSGNIVHNLGMAAWQDTAYDWAIAFDERIKELLIAGDRAAIVNYDKLGREARMSIPTNEHFLPLLYAIAAGEGSGPVSFFTEKVTMGSISMRSLRIG